MARDSVFISYRRSDAGARALGLARELKWRHGEERVFFDTENIEGGQSFPKRLQDGMDRARVVLVVMGATWLTTLDEDSLRRIDDPADWVRREVEGALGSEGVTVIPMLVDEAKMPRARGLPPAIARLAELQHLRLDHAQFQSHAEQIVARLVKLGVRLAPADAARPSGAGGHEPTELDRYRAAAEAAHATIELAGFQTRLRVPIDLEELHVPLHALVDLRGQGDAEFADAEHAASCLRGAEGTLDIPLSDGFREAHERRRRGLVILGDPGSGKTTQLKRLLLWLLRQGGSGLGLDSLGCGNGEPLLPVFLKLRELRDHLAGLEAFIEQQVAAVQPDLSPGFGTALVQRGHLLLLFDGLDEVSDPKARAEVARWIEKLTWQRPNCKLVVTCRFAGYGGEARLDEQFLELHLRPLTREQSEQFIVNWYRIVETGLALDPAQGQRVAQEKATALVERLREGDFRSTRVVQMTRNPLLLANLCLVHRDRGTLPKGRAPLYDECTAVLLERWREGKGLAVAVSSQVGRRALQPAALWMHGQAGGEKGGEHGQGEEGRTRASAAELAPVLEPALKAARWQGGAHSTSCRWFAMKAACSRAGVRSSLASCTWAFRSTWRRAKCGAALRKVMQGRSGS
jgi:hypothetical protein